MYLFLHRKFVRNILTFNQYFKNLKLKEQIGIGLKNERKTFLLIIKENDNNFFHSFEIEVLCDVI